MTVHYDPMTDNVVQMPKRPAPKQLLDSWLLERPMYDIRFDQYWLVTRNREGYVFSGPVALSREALNLLPAMSDVDRLHAKRYLPRGDDTLRRTLWVIPYVSNQDDGA